MPPDKELDGVHECKREEGEGGSDEVEQGEGSEDQVCCQLVIFRVAVKRKVSFRDTDKTSCSQIPKPQFYNLGSP